MKIMKSILGYFWAVFALFIALATFLGYNHFSKKFAETTGLQVNPRFSGGAVVAVVDHGAYQTSIHRPVFDDLIGQTKEGFVQINWAPAAGLPPVIREGIDYDRDGREDFIVTLDTATGQAMLIRNHPSVMGLDKIYHLRDGWAVRILLNRQVNR